MITPAIKHDHQICAIPVFPEKADHALLYLVAGVRREDFDDANGSFQSLTGASGGRKKGG
jgi:hypothetical protein